MTLAKASPAGQGRAKGLYDEQLQRVQQERRLFRGDAGKAPRPERGGGDASEA
jgi:hypothetical protein